MSHRGERTEFSERARDYRLRTAISHEELFVRQIGASWANGDTRRIEIFKVYPGQENPDPRDRIILSADQAEALLAALKDHLRWEHNY